MHVRQSACFLTDPLDDARLGLLVPAAFQRPYQWSRDDVEALWTSLAKGWPIGSFLIWEPPQGLAQASRPRLGPVMPDASPARSGRRTAPQRPSLILDGQNRLASLAWSLHPPGGARPAHGELFPAEADTWDPSAALVCDWQEDRIRFVPSEEASCGLRLPVAALADTSLMWRACMPMLGLPGGDDAIGWFDRLAKAFRSARAVVTVLEDATPGEAVEAFRHIAKAGQPVQDEDIKSALTWLGAAPDEPGATRRMGR